MYSVSSFFVSDREVVVEKERFVVWRANDVFFYPYPLPSMNSWSQHIHY